MRDTVELFYLPGSRKISLRFLAWHLLQIRMSSRLQDTHDSIEDARALLSTCHTSHVLSTCHLTRPRVTGTALALYDKYVELKAIGQGAVDAAIQQLYDIGRETRWEVPD